MCGGGGDGGSDSLDYQREQDRKRQQRIAQGKKQLDQIFGELEGKEKVAKYDYLNLNEDEFRNTIADILSNGTRTRTVNVPYYPNYFNLGGSSMAWSARQNRQQQVREFTPQAQAQLQKLGIGVINNPTTTQYTNSGPFGIRQATQVGGGPSFDLGTYLNRYRSMKNNPDAYTLEATGNIAPIWEQQEQAYLDFANPQLLDQYADAQEDMTYALARQGVGRSSIASENRADLDRDYQLQQQGVAEQAKGYASQARADISSQKQQLLNMLIASADPGATATAARSAMDSIRSQPAFSPLGPLFQNATAGLAAGYGANQAMQQRKRYDDIVYGGDPDRSSGSVRR